MSRCNKGMWRNSRDCDRGAGELFWRRERFNQRVTLHRVLGCSSGYKTCEMVNQKVVIR
jgi:hypothetical protein